MSLLGGTVEGAVVNDIQNTSMPVVEMSQSSSEANETIEPNASDETNTASSPIEENVTGEELPLDWIQSESVLDSELVSQLAMFSLDQFENTYADQLTDIERVIYSTFETKGIYQYHSGNYLSIELKCEGAKEYAYGIAYDPDYANNPEFQKMLSQVYADTIKGFDAYIKDYPRNFWARGLYFRPVVATATGSTLGKRTIISRIEVYASLYYNGILAEKSEVESAIDTVEKRIRDYLGSETGRYQKVAAIHDYLAGNITYWGINDSRSHTITGALLERYGYRGVCESYAKLFKIICDDFGIPCVLIAGRSTENVSVADHMWNCVKMEDGQWYMVDVTWDSGSGFANHSQLLLGNDRVGDTHIPYGVFTDFSQSSIAPYTPFVMPEISETSYAGSAHVHREVKISETSSTCSVNGIQKYQCICGANKREQTLPTRNHSWGKWYLVTEASVTENGVQRRVCNSCGTSQDSLIPKLAPTAENKTRDFVKRLYRLVLGREAEAAGREDWVRVLQRGEYTGGQAAYGFIFGEEYKRKQTSNSDFVEMLYQTLMNRSSDASGKNTWVTFLEGGVTREGVFAGFVNSVEFGNICRSYGIQAGSWASGDILDRNPQVTCFVGRLYQYCLERKPDKQGQSTWVSLLLDQNFSGRECARGFFYSVEFDRRVRSDEEFLRIAYRTLLNREPDQSGLNVWKQVLRSGGSRDSVVEGFLNSVEFQRICNSYGVKW